MTIIPAILRDTPEKFLSDIETISPATKFLHLDICGAPYTATYIPTQADLVGLTYQYDIMGRDSFALLETLPKSSLKAVVLHIDDWSTREYARISDYMSTANFTLLLSANQSYPIDKFIRAIRTVRMTVPHVGVQVMGIAHIGMQGAPWSSGCLSLIKAIRREFPGIYIQVDGAMNEHTIPLVTACGVETFVVGSRIMGVFDPVGAYQDMCDVLHVE